MSGREVRGWTGGDEGGRRKKWRKKRERRQAKETKIFCVLNYTKQRTKKCRTHKNHHPLPHPPLHAPPRPPIHKRILPQPRRRLERLERKRRIPMIQVRGVRVHPWALPDGGPDQRFLDVGGRLVVAREEAHGGWVGDCAAEELGEERVDGRCGVWGQMGGVGGGAWFWRKRSGCG